MSETIAIEMETMAKKLLKKDGNPRANADEEQLETLHVLRDENPDVKLWFELPEPPAEEPEEELTIEQGWIKFWNDNKSARDLTTELGRPRSNLTKTKLNRAKELLKEHGF